jgi:hypothetical protein
VKIGNRVGNTEAAPACDPAGTPGWCPAAVDGASVADLDVLDAAHLLLDGEPGGSAHHRSGGQSVTYSINT